MPDASFRSHRFGLKAFGLLLLFLALLLFLSLATFDPADPTLNHAAGAASKTIQNGGGMAGAYAAGMLNDLFGCAALVAPVCLGVRALGLLGVSVCRLGMRWLGVFALWACVLAGLSHIDAQVFGLIGGGFVGWALCASSVSFFSEDGAWVAWLFLFLVGVRLFFSSSSRAAGRALRGGLSFFGLFSRKRRKGKKARKEKDRTKGEKGAEAKPGKEDGAEDAEKAPSKVKGLLARLGLRRASKGPKNGAKPKKAPPLLLEEDLPFADGEEGGVPLDLSFARQYALAHPKPDAPGTEPKPEDEESSPRPSEKQSQKAGISKEASILDADVSPSPSGLPGGQGSPSGKAASFPSDGAKPSKLPPSSLLTPPKEGAKASKEELARRARALVDCLASFNIQSSPVKAVSGPVLTTYSLRIASSVPASAVSALAADLACALDVLSVSVQERDQIDGEGLVVDVLAPNRIRRAVNFREVVESRAFAKDPRMSLPLPLGVDTAGIPRVVDLARAPHLFVSGAKGQGRGPFVRTLLTGLLLRKDPSSLKLLLVDSKRKNFQIFEEEPHLLHPLMEEQPFLARKVLSWAVKEMDERLAKLARLSVPNIEAYNAKLLGLQGKPSALASERMPFVVLAIDELAEFEARDKVQAEKCIRLLAQGSRSCGIHMILSTREPRAVSESVKENIPFRLCFGVRSEQESVAALSVAGAERLLGAGDMLERSADGSLLRLHAPALRDEDVLAVGKYWKERARPDYAPDFLL